MVCFAYCASCDNFAADEGDFHNFDLEKEVDEQDNYCTEVDLFNVDVYVKSLPQSKALDERNTANIVQNTTSTSVTGVVDDEQDDGDIIVWSENKQEHSFLESKLLKLLRTLLTKKML